MKRNRFDNRTFFLHSSFLIDCFLRLSLALHSTWLSVSMCCVFYGHWSFECSFQAPSFSLFWLGPTLRLESVGETWATKFLSFFYSLHSRHCFHHRFTVLWSFVTSLPPQTLLCSMPPFLLEQWLTTMLGLPLLPLSLQSRVLQNQGHSSKNLNSLSGRGQLRLTGNHQKRLPRKWSTLEVNSLSRVCGIL